MSDPTRLSDPRSGSPESLRQLIQAGRSDVPDADRLRSVAGRLGFGVGAGSGPGAVGAAKGATVGLGASAIKIGGVAVLALAGTGTLAAIHLAKGPPTVATAPASGGDSKGASVIAKAREGAAATAPPLFPQAPRAPAASVRRRVPSIDPVARPKEDWLAPASPPPSTSPRVPATESELSLVEQAERELHRDPQSALDLSDRAAQAYPAGSLAQEREVVAIEALLQLRRDVEARARADEFFRAFPGSAHALRIESMLDFDAGVHNP